MRISDWSSDVCSSDLFRQQFPEQYDAAVTTDRFVADARTRWRNSMSAYHQTMRIQAQVVENVQADGATLSALVTASQGAVGSLQAQQAANQLLALSTTQQRSEERRVGTVWVSTCRTR